MNTETPGTPQPQPEAQVTPDRQVAPAPPRRLSERPRPRTSPIIWGAIVLACCAFSAAQLLAPGAIDGTTFIIATIIALGVLLLVVSVVVIARNARHPKR